MVAVIWFVMFWEVLKVFVDDKTYKMTQNHRRMPENMMSNNIAALLLLKLGGKVTVDR